MLVAYLLLIVLLIFFANKFADLYSCVSYSFEDLNHSNDDLNAVVDK